MPWLSPEGRFYGWLIRQVGAYHNVFILGLGFRGVGFRAWGPRQLLHGGVRTTPIPCLSRYIPQLFGHNLLALPWLSQYIPRLYGLAHNPPIKISPHYTPARNLLIALRMQHLTRFLLNLLVPPAPPTPPNNLLECTPSFYFSRPLTAPPPQPLAFAFKLT